MLTRRELLTGGTTLLLLVPIAGGLLGCSAGGGDDAPSCSGIDALSSVDNQHTHRVCVLNTDLSNPPAAGVSYTTSVDSGHSHKVALTQANLTAINAGQTVPVTSSSDVDPINSAAHSHGFMIKKA